MFKILVLETLYTLSDDAAEFQIKDRLSFMRFLRLGFHDRVLMPRRSGCSGSSSLAPEQSTSCSRPSTRT